MKKTKTVCSLLCVLLAVSVFAEDRKQGAWEVPSSKDNFHVFLLMGQSNMAGYGNVLPEDKQPVPRVVKIPTKGELRWEPAAHPLHNRLNTDRFGLGLPFAKEYLKDKPGVVVGLIPVAWGGAGIDQLNKGTPIYADAMAKAKFAMTQGTLKGVLWHQGESDTVNQAKADLYQKKLHTLVSDCRKDLANDQLIFIAGNLAEFYGTGKDHCSPDRVKKINQVRGVLRELPSQVAHTGFVESTGCSSPDHHMVHFDRASYILLGKRYAKVYAELANKPIAPDQVAPYKTFEKGKALNLHVFTPEDHKASDQSPAIVFFFGGGWTGGSPKQFYQQARAFSKHGIVAISAEYRTKQSHGTTPFDCVEDGKSAIRWVRQHAAELGIDPDMIVSSGGSAGGHVAACTGVIAGHEAAGEELKVSSLPNAMILYNPVIDTTGKGYGLNKVGQNRKTEISPCHHVTPGIPPTLVFHGTADKTVPYENVERFARLMKKSGNTCTLVPFDGKGHGFFNGSFFRASNGDDDFNITMEKSLEFLSWLGFLPPKESAGRPMGRPSANGR